MKRDIRINYSQLEEIRLKTKKYNEALEIIEDVINNVEKSLETRNSGNAIEALLESKVDIQEDIKSCKQEVGDINKIFTDYINDMKAIIDAKDSSKDTRVDRDDIWWNVESIKNACTSATTGGGIRKLQIMEYSQYNSYSYNRYNSTTTSEKTLSDTELVNQQENYRKWMEIQGIVDLYQQKLADNIQEMNNLFNTRVVAFEDTDDAYSDKADSLYDNYTSFWERTGDIFLDIVVGIKDIVVGLIKGVVDLVVGIITVVAGLAFMPIVYQVAGIATVIDKVTGGNAPDFLKWFITKRDNYNTMITTILSDPFIIVESLAQESQDMWEEEGIAYFGGYVVGNMIDVLLGSKGLGKLGELSKLGKADDVLKRLDDIPKVTDDVSKITGDIGKIDDIGELGKISKKIGLDIKYLKYSFIDKDDFYIFLRENVWSDKTLSNADKVKITRENFARLTPEQQIDFNVIGDERFLKSSSEFTDWGDWPPINWPDFPGLDKNKAIYSISKDTPVPSDLDRIGSVYGNNFGIMPDNRPPFNMDERAISYIDNPKAYHSYVFDNTYYFDLIDCIKNNDLDAINKLIDKINLKNGSNIEPVRAGTLDRWNMKYDDFQTDELLVKMCEEKGLDPTYGLMGEAAPWYDEITGEVIASGGAGQLNTPVTGDALERFGIIKER